MYAPKQKIIKTQNMQLFLNLRQMVTTKWVSMN